MNARNTNLRSIYYRAMTLILAVILVAAASNRLRADTGTCGGQMITLPFTDVPSANIFFCSIAEAFFSGLTNGTSSTTYSPSANVSREQMAAFITRTIDQSLLRGSNRAALNQYWTTQGENNLGLTNVGAPPELVQSDGSDLWVTSHGRISRVRASDGKLLGVWFGVVNAFGVVCARGKVYVAAQGGTPSLYEIDPTVPGFVDLLVWGLVDSPFQIAYDGQRIWTANDFGSVFIIEPTSRVVTFVTGFTGLSGIVYDGANMWVTDYAIAKLHKLDSNGAILLSADVGSVPMFPAFDGTNIWVPNRFSNTVSVVRATGGLSGTVLATLSGNGLSEPFSVAFDGERILVTNFSGNSVSLWRATDLTPIGTFSTGAGTRPFGACSDGLNFWITLRGVGKLARF